VKGFLVPGTLQTSQNSLEVNFVIEEEGQEIISKLSLEFM